MSNMYAGSISELVSALSGGDQILQDKFKSTDKLLDLVFNKGMSAEAAQEYLQKTAVDRFSQTKAVGNKLLGQIDEAADVMGTQDLLEAGAKKLPKVQLFVRGLRN